MAPNNVVLFISLIAILLTTNKIQGQTKESEKITLFLKEHQVTEIIDVEYRSQKWKYSKIVGAEKSFQITAFGTTFIVDLAIFYPREDSEVAFISKAFNRSDTFLSSTLLLHQGYVRNVDKSFVIGHFNERKLFRGYVITDEVFCIEPHELDKVIVYRFKDVIFPGCSKTNEDLDCSDTKYFKPWYVNKPPSARRLFPNYNLLYDNYLEFYHRLQMKKTEEKKEEKQKDRPSTDKPRGSESKDKKKSACPKNETCEQQKPGGKSKDKKIPSKKSGCPKNETCEQQKPGGKSKDKKIPSKKSGCLKNGTCDHRKPGGKSKNKNEEGKKVGFSSGYNVRSDVSINTSVTTEENEDEYEDSYDEDADEKDDEDKYYRVKSLKDDDRFKDSVNDFLHNENSSITNNILTETSAFNAKHMRKRSLVESAQKYQEQAVKREKKLSNNEPIVKALENDPIEALQCNVQVVIAPSLVKKFGNNLEMTTKDIFIQFTLLNKIFLKTPLRVKGKNTRFTFQIGQVIMHADEFYSPFTQRVDLEYFKRTNQPFMEFCLQIGLVNQHLKSRDFFDGYIPAGKGGICSYDGNIIIVSHGNENTPSPMAIYFAALIRAVTRAMGATDKDSQCAEGSYPNPMQVLKDYLLSDEIVPSEKYSIFTKCNVKEIEKLLQTRGCLETVPQPLCGNAILDPGEECDCGPSGICRFIDECCNIPQSSKVKSVKGPKGCTLIKGAKCASLQECCDVCKIEKMKNIICYSGPGDCNIATCDGKSASCPATVEASNGMICSFNESFPEPFTCKDNKCDQPLCTSFGFEPCTCALGTEKECAYCCLKDGKCQSAAKELKLIADRNFNLPDFTECMGGICVKGKCMTPSGSNVIYNDTLKERPPRLPANSDLRNEFSALYTIIGSAFSVLALYLP